MAGYEGGGTPAGQQVTAGGDAYVAERDLPVYTVPSVESRDEDGLGQASAEQQERKSAPATSRSFTFTAAQYRPTIVACR